MTAKEEKIKEAYGDKNFNYFKEYIDINGWALYPYFQKHELLEKIDELEFDEINFRPKSLQGIENNNGWLLYTGNSIGYYDLVYTDAGNIYPYAVYVSYDSICCVQKITHYQPIQKPKPPIY